MHTELSEVESRRCASKGTDVSDWGSAICNPRVDVIKDTAMLLLDRDMFLFSSMISA